MNSQADVLDRWRRTRNTGPDSGAALFFTLLMLIALFAISTGALIMTGTEWQLRTFSKAQMDLRYLAELGAEMGLSRLNLDETALPDTGYNVLESQLTPTDASGTTIPGIHVNVYAGRTGSATGRTGNFASVVGEAVGFGARSLVRLEVTEESFAKYAYFTDNEGGNIWFGGGDELFGPVHSNDEIKIHWTGARFHELVTSGKTIRNPGNGRFDEGYEENVDTIPLPDDTDFGRLAALATAGGAHFTTPTTGGPTNVEMRIEFVALDVNGDGDVVDPDEGFFRIYRSPRPDWLAAYVAGGTQWQENCGDAHVHPTTGEPWFVSALNHRDLYQGTGYTGPYGGEVGAWQNRDELRHGVPGTGNWPDVYTASTGTASARCHLGGDPRLTLDNRSFDPWTGNVTDEGYLGRVDYMPGATLPSALAAREDADYLFPLDRTENPELRGVIFFEGLVGVSGVLNGRVTVASSDNIVMLDDHSYSVPANAEQCNDIAGFVTRRNFYVADNGTNAPQLYPPTGSYRTYDETPSEILDGVILAIGTSFTVENYDSGPNDAEACEGTVWGRGCLYLTGGLIQDVRGAVGLSSGRGYLKRYAYDANARFCPPPHFPTTGKFVKNRYYEINPEAFQDIAAFFAQLN